jgi:hypothetical protein
MFHAHPSHTPFEPGHSASAYAPLLLEAIALVLTGLGGVHLALLWVMDFNVLAEALHLRPVGVAVCEGLLMVAASYVIAAAFMSRRS